MSLCVFTCDYSYPPTDCSFLEASCNRVGIELHKFGQGASWPSYTDRLRDGADFLKGRSKKYALFLDSADTYVLDPAEVIVAKFKQFNAPFVFSAERNCWPQADLAHHFLGNGTPYRFLNAGAWMGEREWIIENMRKVWDKYQAQWREDDTRCLVEAMIQGDIPDAVIDHNCEIFMSYYGYQKDDMDESNYRRNNLTGRWPSVAHFNGRARGREEAYRKATA